MDSTASSPPYFEGNTLTIQIDGQPSNNLDVTVLKAFEPFTLSCALLVQLDWSMLKLKGQYVLKLFDRRFATEVRRYNKACPWDPKIEDEYRNFVYDDDISALFTFCAEQETDYKWTPSAQKDWNGAHLEAYLQYCCRNYYMTETQVYDRLPDLQGEDIPRLIARVLIRRPSSAGLIDKYLDCPGILLEYIQGYHLTDLEENTPKAAWQQICDEAIRIVNRIGERDIRNEDVKTRNFIIRTDPRTALLKIIMLDFGACVLRKPDQDDQEWRAQKAAQDEEGAIGLVMEKKLKGGFQYTRSEGSERLMREFQSWTPKPS
ncbi:hypothetical protein P152DRAFT_481210 [Eremomyces bilateralis CBS 781.70]|uniref:Protein kinase domain-containing protein n=1 Tax=Eremomyces bilateralis CBS 781.70 TaxID=1392243 RepID=A0A6G1G7S3_9PEZI|nr:uncharacterized protein P152DRAFT_481210 [Eremomyces bilateralis CBS 781.70]KAF1814052.1 hypothetical protein P152DRAFT_481210 [Eremomyces bilateralis CBS 781.70]